jgi:uncharacterized RDD family membrane protein YckC
VQQVQTDHAHLASPAQRFGAWVLDAAIGGLLISPLLLVRREASADDGGLGGFLWLLAVVELVAFAYFIGFDGGKRGATPGKRLLGIRVTDRDRHSPIGYKRAALRRVGYSLGYLALLVGWLWLFIDRQHRAWHDILAQTLVVRTR